MAMLLIFPPVLAFLIFLPAALVGIAFGVGMAFGKKAAVLAAVAVLLGIPFLVVGGYLQQWRQPAMVAARRTVEVERLSDALRQPSSAVPEIAAERPISTDLPHDPALEAFAVLLSEQIIFSDRARPDWADEKPGLKAGVYRWPVRSGLYSTEEECRQALAAAVAQVVAQYAKTYLADPSAMDALLRRPDWLVEMQQNHHQLEKGGINVAPPSTARQGQGAYYQYHESSPVPATSSGPLEPSHPAPFPFVTASGRTNLIEQPLFAETVQKSVGPMHELYALVEFSDNTRAQIHKAWWRTLIPLRLRWVTCAFGAVLAIIAIVLAALRYDLASGGKHRGRLRWSTALTILLVGCIACGLCSL